MDDPVFWARIEVLRHSFPATHPFGQCVQHAVKVLDDTRGLAPRRDLVERLARELTDAVRKMGNPALRGPRDAEAIARELEIALVALDLERERIATGA